MRGRTPKPIALKIAESGASAGRSIESAIPEGVGPAPSFLGTEAKREWRRITRVTRRSELLRATDRAALAAYCAAWGRLVEAERLIARDGLVGEGSTGQPSPSVGVRIVNQASSTLREFASVLGFTPIDRQRVGPIAKTSPGAALAEFLGQSEPLMRIARDTAG